MSGSSSSSPPRAAEVSSSRRPQTAARDKNVGSSSRQAARPAREDQRSVRPHVASSRTGASESQRTAPCQADPRGGRRSVRRLSASFMMALTAPTWIPCNGAGHGGSRRTRRRHRACRKRWILARPCGVCSRYLSGAAEPRTFTFPSLPAGAKDQPWPSQRSEDQPLSERGSVLSPLRRRVKAEQPPSWQAPSEQPLTRSRRATRRRSPGCAPKCKFLSSVHPSWILRLVLLINLAFVFS
jgi:hypothetical protein